MRPDLLLPPSPSEWGIGMSGKYTGAVGRFHLWKESVKERWAEVSIVERD